jgi:hypothetical protein
MLRYSGIELAYLDKLAQAILDTKTITAAEGKIAAARVKHGYSETVDGIIDICEKLGFVWMAEREIKSIESESVTLPDGVWQPSKCGEVKYHFYNAIYNCKANADSCSILLNLILELPYEKEDRDLLRNEEFRKQVRERSTDFHSCWQEYGGWFSNLRKLRDQLIHREYLAVLTRNIPNKTVYDFVPNRIRTGETTRIDFEGFLGTTKRHSWKFRRKGMLLAFPHPFDYVFPKEPINFKQIATGSAKRKLKDFYGVVEYCHIAFERLKGLSEITFKETLKTITK